MVQNWKVVASNLSGSLGPILILNSFLVVIVLIVTDVTTLGSTILWRQFILHDLVLNAWHWGRKSHSNQHSVIYGQTLTYICWLTIEGTKNDVFRGWTWKAAETGVTEGVSAEEKSRCFFTLRPEDVIANTTLKNLEFIEQNILWTNWPNPI